MRRNASLPETGLAGGEILTMRLSLDFVKYCSVEQRAAYFQRMMDTLAVTPGIDRAAIAGTVPVAGSDLVSEHQISAGVRSAGALLQPTLTLQTVSAGYFATVGQAVLDGRAFTRGDAGSAPPVAVISKTMAEHFWPARSPVRVQIQLPRQATVPTLDSYGTVTIVGVVSDARRRLDAPPVEEVYRPILQDAPMQAHLVVRSPLDRADVLARVRAAIHTLDPQQPIDDVRTLEEARQASLSPTRTTATLLSLFALIALAISAVGIGGVVAFSVSQRTSEFGVMLALGAHRHHVSRMILREGLTLAGAGLTLGVVIAALFTRSIRGLLFGVGERDPLTMIVVGLVLLAVTLGACVLPARRKCGSNAHAALHLVRSSLWT